MNDAVGADAPFRAAHFYVEGLLDRPVAGYTNGFRWNG
jgi:hypothetical protein